MSNIACIDLSATRKAMQRKIDMSLLKFRMNNNDEQIRTVIKVTEVTLTISLVFVGHPVMAAGVGEQIIKACQPIVELIQGLGYPVCLCTMTAGAVTMAFNKRKGITLIKDGAIAYLAIQFVPMIMRILINVGSTIK